jgi:hypothetical protein
VAYDERIFSGRSEKSVLRATGSSLLVLASPLSTYLQHTIAEDNYVFMKRKKKAGHCIYKGVRSQVICKSWIINDRPGYKGYFAWKT